MTHDTVYITSIHNDAEERIVHANDDLHPLAHYFVNNDLVGERGYSQKRFPKPLAVAFRKILCRFGIDPVAMRAN